MESSHGAQETLSGIHIIAISILVFYITGTQLSLLSV